MSKGKRENVSNRSDKMNLKNSREKFKIRKIYCFTLIKVLIYYEVMSY